MTRGHAYPLLLQPGLNKKRFLESLNKGVHKDNKRELESQRKKFKASTGGAHEEEDEDVIVEVPRRSMPFHRRICAVVSQETELQTVPKCPLTRMDMLDPVMNKACRHNYSREGIRQFIGRKGEVECPSVGCNKMVSKASLTDNRELKVQIERLLKQQQAGDDDDETEFTQVD